MKRVQFPRLGEVCCETVLDNGLKIQVVPRPGYLKSYAFFATSYGGMNVRFRKDGVWQETPAGGQVAGYPCRHCSLSGTQDV